MQSDLFWLDDYRLPPDGWDHAETYHGAVARLAANDYRHGSLDHDLFQYWGHKNYSHWNSSWEDSKTGLDVLEYIIENNRWPSESLAIHTDVTHKREEMADLIRWYGIYDNEEWYTRYNTPDPVAGYIFWNNERPDEQGLFKWSNWNGVPHGGGYFMADW